MTVTDENCIFCKIVAGEIPADVIRRGERAIAFRDLEPQAPTHVLIIPTDHHVDAAELAAADPAALVELVALAAEVAKSDGLVGYRLVFNTGIEGGQIIFHTHLHLLGGRALTWPPG